ncbi:MAG: 7TM diverse intracellular signaling domain-containing protein [Sphingomonadales bacterium]
MQGRLSIVHRWRILAVLALLLGLFGHYIDPAAAQLKLEPGAPARNLAPHIKYFLDPSYNLGLDDVLRSGEAPRFQDLDRRHIDFGFIDGAIWLRLPVINADDDAGIWRLDLNARFMTELDAYLLVEGAASPRLLVHDGPLRDYAARDVALGVLSGTFELAAGERAELLIRYVSEGTTALPLMIETEASFIERRLPELLKHVAFYTLLGLTIVYALILMFLWPSHVVGAYILFLVAVLLYIAQIDGYAFQYLWPGAPVWNAHASTPLALLLVAAAANFSRVFLATKTLGRHCDRVMWALIGLPGVFMLAYLLVDKRLVKEVAFILPVLVAASALMVGTIAHRRGRAGTRFFLFGWSFILLCTVLTALIQWIPGIADNYAGFDLLRIGMVVDVLMMSAAIMDQINRLRLDRDEALRRSFQTQHHLSMLRGALGDAERLAASRGMVLASAGHDMRQPLYSLRAAMLQLVGHPLAERQTIAQLQRSLSYLEEMIERYLKETPRDDTRLIVDEPLSASAAGDMFVIGTVLENLNFMFADDAAARGLKLRCVGSRLTVDADALVVMRILSNFLSNAIRFTDRGKVLLGCRRRGTEIVIEVHDSGPGIAAADIGRIFDAFERGAGVGNGAAKTANGHGLGLAIAASLAREHGYRLDAYSVPGQGSVFRLIVPRG